jgi:hypothetical protein
MEHLELLSGVSGIAGIAVVDELLGWHPERGHAAAELKAQVLPQQVGELATASRCSGLLLFVLRAFG